MSAAPANHNVQPTGALNTQNNPNFNIAADPNFKGSVTGNPNPAGIDEKLDPYTAKAENANITPQQKIDGLKEIIKAARHGMLTTRSPSGELHSRMMAPASYENLHFNFLANNVSHKFDEIQSDEHVNLSFVDHATTNWVSISGIAKINQDRTLIKKLWSPFISAYFGDLHDGVHRGDENDPRVSVIEVIPSEIRYWIATKGKIGQAFEVAKGAVTGKSTAPGELRTITSEEVQLVEGLHTSR